MADGESRQLLEEYLTRLQRWLELKVARGEITQQTYQQMMMDAGRAVNEPGRWGWGYRWYDKNIDQLLEQGDISLPYFDEIMVKRGDYWLWEEEMRSQQTSLRQAGIKTQQAQAKAQTTKEGYIPYLDAYLRKKGGISPAERQEILADASQQIEMGVPPQRNRYYTDVRSWLKEQGQEFGALVAITHQQNLSAQRKWFAEMETKKLQERADVYGRGQIAEWGGAGGGLIQKRQAELGAFKQWQPRALGQLEEPVDWIERWRVEHMMPPFLPGQAGAYLTPEAQKYWGATGPEAPSWLAQLVPGLEAGQRLPREPRYPLPSLSKESDLQYGQLTAPTPSWRWFEETPWSTREKYRGYAQWAGRSWQDIMEEATKGRRSYLETLPQMPRGAGATRWRPAGQR